MMGYLRGDNDCLKELRTFPKGRKFLCEMAVAERKNTPAWLRAMPKKMGAAAGQALDECLMNAVAQSFT